MVLRSASIKRDPQSDSKRGPQSGPKSVIFWEPASDHPRGLKPVKRDLGKLVTDIDSHGPLRSKKKEPTLLFLVKEYEAVSCVLPFNRYKIHFICTKEELLTPSELGAMSSQRRHSQNPI